MMIKNDLLTKGGAPLEEMTIERLVEKLASKLMESAKLINLLKE